jgi:hypothetical protein
MVLSTSNLFSNLLTWFIIFSLIIVIYCKVTNKTLGDVIRELKEGITGT